MVAAADTAGATNNTVSCSTATDAAISIAAAAPCDALHAWMRTSPDFYAPHVVIRAPSPTVARGLFFTTAIAAGTPVVRVPPTHLITPRLARAAPHVAAVLAAAASTPPTASMPDAQSDAAALLLFVVAELAQPESRFAAWLQALPPTFDTPVAREPGRAHLAGAALQPLAATLRTELLEMYDLWFVPHALRSTHPVVIAAYPPDVCSLDLFVRAHAVLESRAFQVDDDTVLAPFADMANHRPASTRNTRARGYAVYPDTPKPAISVDSVKSADPANPADPLPPPGLELYVDRDVAAGDELLISYGPLPNWQLLLHYGFALPSNPDDRVALALQPPQDDPTPLHLLKMLFLGLDGAVALDVDHSLSMSDPLPPALLASARLLLLDEVEAARVTVSTADFGKIVSPRNEAAVVAQLTALVEALLDGLNLSEEHDKHEHDKDLDSFAKYCAVYVNGQTEILNKTLEALQALSATIPDTPLTSVSPHPPPATPRNLM